jgi:hypothetical protein
MSGREERVLTRAIQEMLWSAGQIEDRLSRDIPAYADALSKGKVPDEIIALDEALIFYIRELFRDISILAERLGLPQFARDVRLELKDAVAAKVDLASMPLSPDGDLYSEWLGKARRYHGSLATLTKAGNVDGLQIFQTILENTAVIIKDKSVPPKNESDVRNEILRVLQYSFRDVLKEVTAAKIFKNYKPDIGVASLMAAAEYKFVDSETALRKALDDIYTDMKGYSGHYDWRTFYAVIYMTEPFVHQKDVDEEFRFVNAEANWFPIVLNGAGERKAKPATASR